MPDASGPLAPEEEESKFVLETDEAPEFWQFLNGLRGDDLLVELIVNDLDAHSPVTEISICSATDPVSADGIGNRQTRRAACHRSVEELRA